MNTGACPRYSGSGAAAGRATCRFFASMSPGERLAGVVCCVVAIVLILMYLRSGELGRPLMSHTYQPRPPGWAPNPRKTT
jgi:hypothetical protein